MNGWNSDLIFNIPDFRLPNSPSTILIFQLRSLSDIELTYWTYDNISSLNQSHNQSHNNRVISNTSHISTNQFSSRFGESDASGGLGYVYRINGSAGYLEPSVIHSQLL